MDNPNQTKTLATCLDLYRDQYLRARNLARRTGDEYADDLEQAIAFSSTNSTSAPRRGIEKHHLEAFLAELGPRGIQHLVTKKAMGHESLETTSIYIDLAREQMDRELQENTL